jgi:hypothetical protein
VSGVRFQAGSRFFTTCMKLRQNGTGFLMIKLAASMAGPGLNSKQIEHQFLFRFDRPFFWPAAGLTPDTCILLDQ